MEEFCAAEIWGHIFGISSFVGGAGARMYALIWKSFILVLWSQALSLENKICTNTKNTLMKAEWNLSDNISVFWQNHPLYPFAPSHSIISHHNVLLVYLTVFCILFVFEGWNSEAWTWTQRDCHWRRRRSHPVWSRYGKVLKKLWSNIDITFSIKVSVNKVIENKI